jgi:hypothetical protein
MKPDEQSWRRSLNPKNTKLEVCRHFPSWPTPPSLEMLDFWFSAEYHSILMELETQYKRLRLNPKSKNRSMPIFYKMAVAAILRHVLISGFQLSIIGFR